MKSIPYWIIAILLLYCYLLWNDKPCVNKQHKVLEVPIVCIDHYIKGGKF